jgi:hypothetical protein
MPSRAQTLQKEMRSLHTLIRSTRTFIYLQYRVLLENKFSKLNELFCNYKYRIGGVMVSMLGLSAVDREFEPRSGHTKDFKIDMCCFSAKHTTLRRKNTDWLARNQNDVSEWSDMSTPGLLFQWATTIKIQLSVLV